MPEIEGRTWPWELESQVADLVEDAIRARVAKNMAVTVTADDVRPILAVTEDFLQDPEREQQLTAALSRANQERYDLMRLRGRVSLRLSRSDETDKRRSQGYREALRDVLYLIDGEHVGGWDD